MPSRTLTAALLALVVALPVAAAQDEAKPAATADEAVSFLIHAEPREMKLAPGAEGAFVIVAKSRVEQAIQLRVDAPAGLRAALVDDSLKVGPETRGATKLLVRLAEEPSARAYAIALTATNADGEHQTLKLVVYAAPHKPEPTARPDDGPAFKLAIEPGAQRIEPGGAVRFTVAAHGRANATLALSAVAHGGYAARIEPATLTLQPGERANATLVVEWTNASRPRGEIVVVAKDDAGHAARAVAIVHLAAPEEPEPAKRPAEVEIVLHDDKNGEPATTMTLTLDPHRRLRLHVYAEEAPDAKAFGRYWLKVEKGEAYSAREHVNAAPGQ